MRRILVCAFICVCSCTGVVGRVVDDDPSCHEVVTTAEVPSRSADFVFHGSGEYAVHEPGLPRGAEPRTLSAWFRTTARDGAHVVANWGTPQLGQRFGILLDGGRVKLVGESQDIMTSHEFADGRWHHAVATFDGSYAVVYVDGRPEVSGHLRLDTRGDRLVVGNAPIAHAPEPWFGEIDGVTIHHRVLAAGEIAGLARP